MSDPLIAQSPARAGAGGPGFRSRGFVLLLVTASLGMTTLNLALPILPITVGAATGRASLAGTVTAVVALLTVLAELRSSRWTRRIGPIWLLRVALVVQMVALGGLAEFRSLPAMLVFGGLLGAGFGTVATVTAATVGSFVAPEKQGEAIGFYGLAASIPGIFGPSAALLLLARYGPAAVFWTGSVACLVGLGTAAFLRTPGANGPTPSLDGALAVFRNPRVLVVWLSFVLVTVTYGAAVSFSPLFMAVDGLGSAPLFLLLFGITRTVTRLLAGRVLDRSGDSWLTWSSLAAAAAGLALLPARVPALTILGAVLFGAGFGAIQTSTFVSLLARGGRSRAGQISGLWNMAVDVGFGLGTLVLASAAAGIGYIGVFWLLPVLVVVAISLRAWEALWPRPGAGGLARHD